MIRVAFAGVASEIDGRLVAVVAVCDEQLAESSPVERRDRQRRVPSTSTSGSPRRRSTLERAVGQHEDRLGLHPGSAQQAQPLVTDCA